MERPLSARREENIPVAVMRRERTWPSPMSKRKREEGGGGGASEGSSEERGRGEVVEEETGRERRGSSTAFSRSMSSSLSCASVFLGDGGVEGILVEHESGSGRERGEGAVKGVVRYRACNYLRISTTTMANIFGDSQFAVDSLF